MSKDKNGILPAPPEAVTMELCRGSRGKDCRFALEHDPGLIPSIETTVRETGWDQFVLKRYPKAVPSHGRFRVAVAGCPNGCARPHIADLGFIRSARPIPAAPEACTGCSLCVDACPEGLVSLDATPEPHIDQAQCLLCGRCARACEFGSLVLDEPGWRLVAGGKLGRKPRLALELGKHCTLEQAVAILCNGLTLMMHESRPGERLGSLMDRLGDEQVLASLKRGVS